MNVFGEIRAACAAVAARAGAVRIAADPGDYARALLAERGGAAALEPAWDAELHFVDPADPEATLAFVVTLDAINFGSGWFPHLVKRPGMAGYDTVASRLRDRFAAEGPFTADELMAFTPADAAALLHQPPGDPDRDEFLAEIAAALAELGDHLREHWGGSFVAPVDAAERSAARLVELLRAMPRYRDVADYGTLRVPFYKRAQITASDLALALGEHPLGRFDDLDELTIFADNLVPHVLRVDGVLACDDALLAQIAAGRELPAGSPEEVEIRAVALHAVERMVAALRADGVPVRAQQLDVLLWERGRAARYRRAPRHRTRTVFY